MIERPETPTKGEAAFVSLREAIRTGALHPGQRVTLTGLADTLGMSLTPVREALRKLAEHGLVHHTPNKRTIVAEQSLERAREVYWLRLTLEPMAIELAAERVGPETLVRIREACLAVECAVEEQRVNDVPHLNAELHRLIYEACGSIYLCDFIARLWDGVPFQSVSLEGRHEQANIEHRQIIDALARHDGALARRLLTEHIQAGASRVLGLLENNTPERNTNRVQSTSDICAGDFGN